MTDNSRCWPGVQPCPRFSRRTFQYPTLQTFLPRIPTERKAHLVKGKAGFRPTSLLSMPIHASRSLKDQLGDSRVVESVDAMNSGH